MNRELMIAKIESLEEIIAKCIRVIIFLLFFSLIALVFYSVLSRNVFDAPANFSDLLSLVFLNWFIFIASALAMQSGAHVSIDFAIKKLSESNKMKLQVFITVVSILFYIAVIYTGVIFCWKSRYNTMPMVWDLNRGLVYMSIPIGFFVMLITHSLKTLKYILKGYQKQDLTSIV